MRLHPLVREKSAAYLARVDAAAPGLVEGLYLVGSVALDDFRPGASDIDFVAVTSRPLAAGAPDLDALRTVHRSIAGRPYFDGSYVTWADLAGDPSKAGAGAGTHEGRLHGRPAGDGDIIAWHTLAGHGVAVRGPRAGDLDVWTDRTALTSWCRRNATEYWRPWLVRASRLSPLGLASLTRWGPAWCVLGISRLHHTIATGAITSKSGAGVYAREAFDPRWRPVIEECLLIRRGERTGLGRPVRRRRAALDFLAMAIEDIDRH